LPPHKNNATFFLLTPLFSVVFAYSLVTGITFAKERPPGKETERMKQYSGKMKKGFAHILTLVLVFAMVFAFSTSALAAPKSSSDTEAPGNSGNAHASKDEKSADKADKSNGNKNGSVGEQDYYGISVDKIQLAIDSVTDETEKAALQALLDEYTSSLDAKTGDVDAQGMSELAQAASDARKALKDGLDESGFTLGSILGWQEWKYTYNYEYNNLQDNLETIAGKIAALDDSDENKAVLEALVTAYQDALAAEAAAGEDADLEALADAVKDAQTELYQALTAAGVLPLQEQDMLQLQQPDTVADPELEVEN
jgi:hypothetical protein